MSAAMGSPGPLSPLPRLDFLGRGLAAPLRIEGSGMARIEGPDRVQQAIFTILETEPGERLMLPDFGCALQQFIMEPNTYTTHAAMAREMNLALVRLEPRISVDDIVFQAADDPAAVVVEIRYRHLHDGRPDNLVFPFYFR